MKKLLVALSFLFSTVVYGQVVGPNEARLTWEYPTNVEIWAFVIERQKDGGSWVEIESNLDGDFRTYLDVALTDGTYCYQVRARNSINTSEPSNVACKTINTTPPPGSAVPPTNLQVQ